MRQMNGIYQMEQSRYGKTGRGQEIPDNNITTDVNKGQETIEAPSFSYVKSKADSVKTGTIMENFDEYRKQKLEREKEHSVDEEEIRKEQRERAKDLAASLSEDEIQRLRAMGIDVESAKLSDLQGIVGTMRQQDHKEELTRMIQGLQMEMMSQEDRQFLLSNDELVYLLRNELPTTKQNLLMAHYSGSRMQEQQIPEEVFAPMKQQVEAIIQQTGYPVNEDSLAGAKTLLGNGLPITTDTMKQYLDYQVFLGQSITEVDFAETTKVLAENKANAFMDALQEISDETIFLMTKQDMDVTIASALTFEENVETEQKNAVSDEVQVLKETAGTIDNEAIRQSDETAYATVKQPDEISYMAVKQMRMLQEIRLTMTVEAANRLVTKDFNIDTKPLSKVVDELREIERQMLSYMMLEEDIKEPEPAARMFFETKNMVLDIAKAPADILATPLRQGDFTIRTLYDEASVTKAGTTAFETVQRSYEAVQTVPRYDMGDRITKAFSNIEEMLGEMNLEASEENMRAVRILGYNSMEITESNLAQIVTYDREINELILNFSPATVLAVIKEGKNPMDEPIDSLNRKIRERNDKGAVSEVEDFAGFLRDMEKQGVVDENERESYIGLYRVMNQLAKSGNREAGYLFASGANLTIRNLISAMRSAKASGIDVAVNDAFGMLEGRTMKGKRIDEQIEKAFLTQDAKTARARTLDMTEEVILYMQNNGIEESLVNAGAVSAMMSERGGIYGMANALFAKLSKYKNASEDAVDEETENMTDSLLGEEIMPLFEPEGFLEQLAGGSDMSDYYKALNEKLTNGLYEAGVAKTIATEDISMMKTVQAGFRILGGLARKNQFQIPLQTETGIQVVNLSLEHGNAHGTIQIAMNSDEYGSLEGRFVLEENGLSGRLVAKTSEDNFKLMEKEAQFVHALQKEGVVINDIALGTLAEQTAVVNVNPTTFDLYNTMVACVKAMRSFV